MDVLKQRPGYDARLNRNDVRSLRDFGAIQVPAGTIDDSQMTSAELAGLQSLVKAGYRLFDMTNEPVLIYGAVNSPLVARDIHTLFYNTYREQMEVVSRLKNSDKTLIVWSAGHWSETLDSTYVEYRLPIVSEYVIRTYPYTYRIGRFVIFSKQPLTEARDESTLLRNRYDLGYAPSRMEPYKQEFESELITKVDAAQNIGESKPDALQIEADATGGGVVAITLLKNGERVCFITFKVPRGKSENFIRLSNLPAYIRYAPDKIAVEEGDVGTRIRVINNLKFISE
jgi:hypothetical protein